MTADVTDNMLLQESVPSSPKLSEYLTTDSLQDDDIATAPATPPVLETAKSADQDVSMPSISMPDEAALAAAAAAMAAAAQGGLDGVVQQPEADASMNGSDDLNSYLLAAAAASVHAQQQLDSEALQKTQSEESFDSTATPVPASVHTSGTSVNGSDEDDARAAIHDTCRKYVGDASPYPLAVGKRMPGGCAEMLREESDAAAAAKKLEALPHAEAAIELGKTRCYWALLSADYSKGKGPTGEKLDFVYLDPILQQHMAEQADRLVGSDFYDFVHPDERDRVKDDMQKIVESRTLFGSVTRCRYSRVPRIREVLGAVNAARDPDADRYVEDDNFVAIDIVINWIGDGMLLCFFHAIIDKAAEDNDEQHKSDWTNWCGTPNGSFTVRQCDTLWKQVKAVPREAVPESGPVHVFQVIEAGAEAKVLLSWPPPRLFVRDADAQRVTQSDTTVFNDGSYFADDFARLAQGVSIAPGSSSLSDANTSCTRRFRAKHTLTTEGKVRSIESVLIPYGGIILACFHTTFQQQLPPADPKSVLQAQTAVQSQAERRKAQDDALQSSPNKRPRTEDLAQDIAQTPSRAPATISNAPAPNKTETTIKTQQHPQSSDSGVPLQPSTQAAKAANGQMPKTPAAKVAKPAGRSEASSILSNPSLMYTNAPAKAPTTPAKASRTAADRAIGTPQNGASSHSPAGADSPNSGVNKACTGCGKINSPEWRRGPSGHKTLCNACGLRYARSLTRRKKKKGKDGEVEFIEPTGDPTVVPKSRGGGGGSLPGVHRKNSKKRKEDEAAKAAVSGSPGAANDATNGTPIAVRATSTASSSPASTAQSPATATPASISASPALKDTHKPQATATVAPAPVAQPVKLEPPEATATAIASTNDANANDTDPAHSIAVSIALDAIAQATSTVPSLDAESLSLPVSNAISRAIAATIGSTEGGANGLLTSQALPSANTSEVPSAAIPDANANASSDLDPVVSAAALQTIESVVSEALYKQLVNSGLPDTSTAASTADKGDALVAPSIAGMPMGANGSSALDLSEALTADAIRAAAQAAIAQGVGSDEPTIPQSDA